MTRDWSKKDDGEIIEMVLAGDTELYGILIERHRDHVMKIAMKRVPLDEAGDLAHEAFVRAYSSLPRYGGKSPFGNWLAVIAVRACHDYWRERYRSRETSMNELGEEHVRWLENTASEESGLMDRSMESRRNAAEVLAWALERMSPEDRAVLELVHLEERSVREASEILGWSVPKTKVRAFRSRKKLRRLLEGAIG
ncbi:MAG: RNA polymerase sigma factor [Candidatus Krumholzibacteria bacterium]|jgi:RNA polymerase sigma-70 factor (ECF subfamily)|nr:RNA polymerase sigma factor [Candidatus Krumholzibacteria bacterium]